MITFENLDTEKSYGQGHGHRIKKGHTSVIKYMHLRVVRLRLKGNCVSPGLSHAKCLSKRRWCYINTDSVYLNKSKTTQTTKYNKQKIESK